MHSFDRTLLAKLGFADPDKKDRRHDLACQYLALPEKHERICKIMGGCMDEGERRRLPVFEMPIIKGEGQYATTIGFVDLMLPFQEISTDKDGAISKYKSGICLEIKIFPITIGDIFRQIGLYRAHAVGWPWCSVSRCWILATTFSLSALDVSTLRSASISHIVLGDPFDAWVAEQISSPTLSKSSVMF